MIIKSSQRSNGKQLGSHLISNENETVTLIQSGGVFSKTLPEIMNEFENIASGSRAIKPFFHVSISPEESAKMTAEDWGKSWKLHDEIHGLADLQFVEVEHEKKGRVHRHRVYNRVNPETLKAVNLPWTRMKNERIARQLEVELGHSVIQGKHNRAVIAALKEDGLREIAEEIRSLAVQSPSITEFTHKEHFLNKRGVPMVRVREELAQAWAISDNSKSFEAALAERGFVLAQGDKAVMVVSQDGVAIPLMRNINVARNRKKSGLVPIRKADLDKRLPSHLPDIDAVLEAQAERQSTKDEQIKRIQQAGHLNETEMEKNMLNQIQPAGQAEKAVRTEKGSKEDKPEWQIFRERMLFDEYGKKLVGSDIAKYWKVAKNDDGKIIFTNKNGELIDRGSAIDVNAEKRGMANSAAAAVLIAQAKGWSEVRASGTDEFKKAIFASAKANGLSVQLDSEEDKKLWDSFNAQSETEKSQTDAQRIQDKIKEKTGKEVKILDGASSNIADDLPDNAHQPGQGDHANQHKLG